jgi:hypothetical protein
MIRDYIKIIEGGGGSKNYEQMLQNYMTTPKSKSNVKNYISWAKQNLVKTDRIIWFLRWLRIELAATTPNENDNLIGAEALGEKSELDKLNKNFGTHYSTYDMLPIKSLQTKLVHFLSLPINKIQEIKWLIQSPKELISDFTEIEEEWKISANTKNQLEYDRGDEPEKIITFNDGYAWFNLDTYYCRREADAMGHCGNGGGKSSETIFSLRSLVYEDENKSNWHPVLTFICDSEGYLGEMKGRGNDKPAYKYHPYIIALLKSNYVTGINGGGYMPENNFSLDDLDEEEKAALIKLKPTLADVDEVYRSEGMSKRVLSLVENKLSSKDFEMKDFEYQPEHKRFVVKRWQDFDRSRSRKNIGYCYGIFR